MREDEVRRARDWIRRHGRNARLGQLGRDVFGTDFGDERSVESLQRAIDEMIRNGIMELRYDPPRGVIASLPDSTSS